MVALGSASDCAAMPEGISGLACGAAVNANAATSVVAAAAANSVILRMGFLLLLAAQPRPAVKRQAGSSVPGVDSEPELNEM